MATYTVSGMNCQGCANSVTNAIKAVFGPAAYRIPVSSTKGQCGHLIAAAGALEGAVCALAIRDGIVPMTANRRHPDPACDLDYISEGARRGAIHSALSNSLGFGGTNCSLVLRSVAD